MNERTQRFLDELRRLCRFHGFNITTSDYDALQVWPLDDGEEPIEHIQDRTVQPSGAHDA